MTTRIASCSCGQLRATAEGEPLRVSMRHCFACQTDRQRLRRSEPRFPRERVATEGRATRYVRTADSGNAISFSFCPDCGATVYYVLHQFPDVVAVPIGAFADPTFPAPRLSARLSVYESRKHASVSGPPDAEHFD